MGMNEKDFTNLDEATEVMQTTGGFDFAKRLDETEYQYRWRVYKAKADGLLGDMNWHDISHQIDAALRPGEPMYDESVYRKEAAMIQRWYENCFSGMSTSEQVADLKLLLEDIRREKVRLRDERTETNRQTRVEARAEQKLDYLEEVIKRQGEQRYPVTTLPLLRDSETGAIVHTDRDMLILLSDWHIGSTFTTMHGEYDSQVAEERIFAFANKVVETAGLYQIKNLYVGVLGDLISGNIHATVRLQNRENVIEQVKTAADILSDFLYLMCHHFDKVRVVSVAGNHSRVGLKDEVLSDERLDDLVVFIADRSLHHVDNIEFEHDYDRFDPTVGEYTIRGKSYVLVHGDYDCDSAAGIAQLGMWMKHLPDVVCMGHLHTASMKEVNGCEVVRNGAVVGSGDSYTSERRMTGTPSQTILVVDKHGICAHIPVDLIAAQHQS